MFSSELRYAPKIWLWIPSEIVYNWSTSVRLLYCIVPVCLMHYICRAWRKNRCHLWQNDIWPWGVFLTLMKQPSYVETWRSSVPEARKPPPLGRPPTVLKIYLKVYPQKIYFVVKVTLFATVVIKMLWSLYIMHCNPIFLAAIAGFHGEAIMRSGHIHYDLDPWTTTDSSWSFRLPTKASWT